MAGAAGTGALIGAAAKGAHEVYKRRASLLSRRAFLIYGGLPIAALAGIEIACSKSGGGPGPDPTPIFVKFAGPVPLEGLLNQTKINGEMNIPGAKKVIPITNGTIMIDESYELLPRSYDGIVIVTDFVKRSTPLELNNSGHLVNLGYTKVPGDVVDDPATYAVWETTRRNNLLVRWGDVKGFGKFFYDKSLFHAEGGQVIKIQDNYNPFPTTVESVISAASYFGSLSGGQIPNGIILESESPGGPRPNPGDNGWLVIYIRDNTLFDIDQTDSIVGPLTSAEMAMTSKRPVFLPGTLQDLWESLGNRPSSLKAYNADGTPSDIAIKGGKIQYFRKVGQTANGDTPDFQT